VEARLLDLSAKRARFGGAGKGDGES